MVDPRIFVRADPSVVRSERTYAALTYLAERHADTPERRARHANPLLPGPEEMVRLAAVMAGGLVVPDPDEEALDAVDMVAALTLVPQARADLDTVELALLRAARHRGMTWQNIAFALGLGTPQAAKQRYARLEGRTDGDLAAEAARTDRLLPDSAPPAVISDPPPVVS